MGRTTVHALLLGSLSALTACGGGGGNAGGSSGSGSPAYTGDLQVVQHAPAADAVQVPLDASVTIRFDGVIVRDCLTEEDVWLATATGTRVPGSVATEGAGRDIRFTPASPLAAETDYVFHLSAFVCDTAGRVLGNEFALAFRTYDASPPHLVTSTLANQSTGVDRLASWSLTFDEPLDAASLTDVTIYLRDVYGGSYPCTLTLAEATRVVVDPCADLAGDRGYILAVAGGNRGITDRAGNVLAEAFTANFRTAPDSAAPRLTGTWPPAAATLSPHAQPELVFDESIEPASIETASVDLRDNYGNVVRMRVAARLDQRRIRLAPLTPFTKGTTLSLTVANGAAALTDLSGNALSNATNLTWAVGSDDVAPRLVSALPSADAERVSLNVAPKLSFDEPLDPASVSTETVLLRAGSQTVSAAVALADASRAITVTPTATLRPNTAYTLTVRGGVEGVRDAAGNTLPADLELAFRTSTDASLPQVILLPADGAAAVPVGSRVIALFDQPIDPTTVTAESFRVTRRSGGEVSGEVTVARAGRAILFEPDQYWTAGDHYRVVLRSGPNGVRELSGNWLDADEVHDFRIGFASDVNRPVVRVSVNAAADARKQNMQVPTHGFSIDVFAQDPVDYAIDPTSFELTVSGPAGAPGPDLVFANATVTRDRLSWRVPASTGLTPGDYTAVASVSDLSGNQTTAEAVSFSIVEPATNKLPFERTHVVWVRTDLDRDGNGRSDFVDDLVKLGFAADGDPRGLNDRMLGIVRDGILAQAHQLFARDRDGRSRGDESVAIRFTTRRPVGVAHMQIALGGLDPEGPRQRAYGDESTGVLGRAYFDQYNSAINDLNIATNPGLGVFPGELFLFQAQIHRRVYPAFVTTFARRFLNLAPGMGGNPVGNGIHDATVVASGFDYARATSEQRVRFDAIFRAADDWASAIGIVLAHEVGHAVGLVAEGPSPFGLYGDASLHNDGYGAADVMSPAVSYDALVMLDYAFRDLDLAYLRQRLILK